MNELHAVILAAGDGDRLNPATSSVPKPLLSLAGRPIIGHVLEALAAGGVAEATIVFGYRADQMREGATAAAPPGMTLHFIENEHYMRGNARSLWAARGAVSGSFLLTMADHLVEPALIRALTELPGHRCRLAVDFCSPTDSRAGEATLALVDQCRVVDLGKRIPAWNALDTGVFWCTPAIFDSLTPDVRDGEAAAVFSRLARAGELDAVDVTGCAWVDIDTADDLASAEAMLANPHPDDTPEPCGPLA